MKVKKIAVFVASLAIAISVQAQGLVTFANSSSTGVTNILTGAKALTTTVWVGLFAATDLNAVANPYAPSDAFVLATPAAAMVAPGTISGGARTISDAPSGTTVQLQIRAWDRAFASTAAGYAECVNSADPTKLFGWSNVMRFAVGGGSLPTPSLTANGLQGVLVIPVVPEPSTLALALLGAIGTLVMFRRRQ